MTAAFSPHRRKQDCPNHWATTLALAAGLMLASTAPAWADKCGTKDRVELPSCANWKWKPAAGKDGYYTLRVTNNCTEKITVKVDIRDGPDKRPDVEAGSHWDMSPPYQESWRVGVRDVKCCPRYSKCSY